LQAPRKVTQFYAAKKRRAATAARKNALVAADS
jgi:hypothetical protein